MDTLLFCTAFILQFVGHRVGDYIFQTDWQAQNKAKDRFARWKHCMAYSLTIAGMMLFAFEWRIAVIVFGLTFLEHFFIDARWPVVGFKKTLEKAVGNKSFDIEKMPFFVLIEIDQSIHYVRCFIIALLIGYGVA